MPIEHESLKKTKRGKIARRTLEAKKKQNARDAQTQKQTIEENKLEEPDPCFSRLSVFLSVSLLFWKQFDQ